jgi:KipI family sensor histidine kinase inhibitor
VRLLAAGDAAVLIEVTDPADVLPLVAAIRSDPTPGITDVVPAELTVLVHLDPHQTRPEVVARWLRELKPVTTHTDDVEKIELPVHYDGEDLADVAELTGLSESEVIAAHTGQEWVVAFSGFAPGFGYLRGVSGDQPLHVPRRDQSRVRVPAGAVALAAGYSGVYPRVSPGGWQLIGRTEASLWDLERNPPALLRPGVHVRFKAV